MNVIEMITRREHDNHIRLTCGHEFITPNPHVRVGNQYHCLDCHEKPRMPNPELVLDAIVDEYVAIMQAQGIAIGAPERIAIRRAANIQYAWYCAMRAVLG